MLKKEPQARLLKKSGKIRKDNKVCYSPYSVSTHSIFWCLNMGFINTAIFVEENSKVCWNFNNYYRLRHQLSLNKENKNKSKQKTFFPINISKPPNKFVEKKKKIKEESLNAHKFWHVFLHVSVWAVSTTRKIRKCRVGIRT